MLFGLGVFMWEGVERRTKRYGYFYSADSDYTEHVKLESQHAPRFDVPAIQHLAGKKVKITCKVLENRESGHLGDRFVLDTNGDYIKPSKPEVGEEVVVGVGVLDLKAEPHAPGGVSVALRPEDGREKFWSDPRQLFRLHDQTVEFHIEETDEPCSPLTTLQLNDKEGVISNGDGTFQYNGNLHDNQTSMKIVPKIERLGDGLFKLERPHADANPGEFFEVKPD